MASELSWMAAAARGGGSVPSPILARDGRYLQVINGAQIDILHWLPGRELGDAMAGDPAARIPTMAALGRAAGQFHTVCDAWHPPADFDRPAWNIDGLLGKTPLWGRFWENPMLSQDDADYFARFRDIALADLRPYDLDYGLIHADLLGENVLIDGPTVRIIDFDDGGWGFRLFELATALIRYIDAPDYNALFEALVSGYTEIRPLNTAAFALILALRSTTYVSWIADRSDLPDAPERQERNARIARNLISAYLSNR